FACSSRLRTTDKWLEQSIKLIANASAALSSSGDLSGSNSLSRNLEIVPSIIHELRQLLSSIRPALENLLAQSAEIDAARSSRLRSLNYRFPGGIVPDDLREYAAQLHSAFQELEERLGRVAAALEDALDAGGSIDREEAEHWLPAIAML